MFVFPTRLKHSKKKKVKVAETMKHNRGGSSRCSALQRIGPLLYIRVLLTNILQTTYIVRNSLYLSIAILNIICGAVVPTCCIVPGFLYVDPSEDRSS